ncbi:FtsP/CotA-like multicopper oxidase with cupredoxin domain [Actinopolyspora biskrensis]|uniref:FtsP/CotA-like multicopper oxidase with cupredoxin domain n=1 Tax=Actinopolyspora biskrensis TaxID=1470178 RepID=A0A852Z5R8_9ACTN|nr:FtsP/CotA-like multicopper oxidase with cupredoxin domain [Actinopolyspora biskrensis]
MSRRRVLRLGTGLAVGGLAAACGGPERTSTALGPDSTAVRDFAREQQRRFPRGRTVSRTVTAAPTTVDLAGSTATAWAYNDVMPGPLLRATAGDRVQVRVRNQLPEPTTVHWHGLAIRNDMDGVPEVTQPPIPAGGEFTYEFIPPDPGTYWYHSHGELQRGRGLFGALIVDDPRDPGDYDVEFLVVLSDWLGRRTPRQVLDELRGGRTKPGHDGHAERSSSAVLGADAGDVSYPFYLTNGRPRVDPETFRARAGQRARIRVINAAEDTTFRVALGGHTLTVTHTDGQPVTPRNTRALLVGMAERYDCVVTLDDGVFPLVASAEGKDGRAFALVRTGSGSAPPPDARVRELDPRPLLATDLRAAESARLSPRTPDRTLAVELGGNMQQYVWRINGRSYPEHEPLVVSPNQRVRLNFANTTMMPHPMHLHGHFFTAGTPDGAGPRKDTVVILPHQRLAVDFDTDNPGQWFTHCHNEYHQAAGMASVLSYRG